MNTKFGYLYRDASNYKTYNEVITSGVLRLKDIESYLKDGTFFIPSEVGLIDLQNSIFTSDDHIWHEIDTIALTNEQPNIDVSVPIFIADFKKAHLNDWNEEAVFKRKGLL